MGVAPEQLQKLADLRAALAFVAQGKEHDKSQLLSLGDLGMLNMSLVKCTEGETPFRLRTAMFSTSSCTAVNAMLRSAVPQTRSCRTGGVKTHDAVA